MVLVILLLLEYYSVFGDSGRKDDLENHQNHNKYCVFGASSAGWRAEALRARETKSRLERLLAERGAELKRARAAKATEADTAAQRRCKDLAAEVAELRKSLAASTKQVEGLRRALRWWQRNFESKDLRKLPPRWALWDW